MCQYHCAVWQLLSHFGPLLLISVSFPATAGSCLQRNKALNMSDKLQAQYQTADGFRNPSVNIVEQAAAAELNFKVH